MPEILFNAFSFLKKNLKEKDIPSTNATIKVPQDYTIQNLMDNYGLTDPEVEAVMINGKVGNFEYIIQDGDRIALLPPGIPGPHRFLLGIRRVT